MSTLSELEMLDAVESRSKQHDGQFYYGVITTGVYCRPSCTSRALKTENLRFFSSIKAAMTAGFRPCKLCRPAEKLPQVARLVSIARYIEHHFDEQLTLSRLAAIAHLSPSRLQRVFKQAFGISPKAYQDAVRIRRFKQLLQKDKGTVTQAIVASGYGSMSRVYGEATRRVGMTPKAYRAKGSGESIAYACRRTAVGLMMMAATDKGVCFVQFGDDEASLFSLLETEFSKAKLYASRAQDAPELDLWMEALSRHIYEGMPRPDLPLDMRGTAFQMKVWQFLLGVEEGEVLSYSEVAIKIDLNP